MSGCNTTRDAAEVVWDLVRVTEEIKIQCYGPPKIVPFKSRVRSKGRSSAAV